MLSKVVSDFHSINCDLIISTLYIEESTSLVKHNTLIMEEIQSFMVLDTVNV